MYATNNIPLSFNKLLPRFTTKFDILIHVLQKEKKIEILLYDSSKLDNIVT